MYVYLGMLIFFLSEREETCLNLYRKAFKLNSPLLTEGCFRHCRLIVKLRGMGNSNRIHIQLSNFQNTEKGAKSHLELNFSLG